MEANSACKKTVWTNPLLVMIMSGKLKSMSHKKITHKVHKKIKKKNWYTRHTSSYTQPSSLTYIESPITSCVSTVYYMSTSIYYIQFHPMVAN